MTATINRATSATSLEPVFVPNLTVSQLKKEVALFEEQLRTTDQDSTFYSERTRTLIAKINAYKAVIREQEPDFIAQQELAADAHFDNFNTLR